MNVLATEHDPSRTKSPILRSVKIGQYAIHIPSKLDEFGEIYVTCWFLVYLRRTVGPEKWVIAKCTGRFLQSDDSESSGTCDQH